ncbi:MAG: RagB/SusD family nutrient uptake outer membrane protein [Bacteroidales bacterium]|nr:RagB/SusD family nutrient uptake outer membrane protein [Bacteroidales bacterium]
MRKSLKSTLSLLLLAGMFSACSLEETPYGVYSNKTFFLTEADAENALMYAYVPINYIEYAQRFTYYFGDLLTDEIAQYGYGLSDVTGWDIKPTTEENLYFFKNIYVALGRCNSVLENVSKMQIPQDKKNRYMGEAYFLRAFHHFNLVKNWGEVPIRIKAVNTVADTQAKKAPIKDVWTQIINDLLEADKLLGINKCQGRVDKVAVQALLSRVYLYLATYKESGSPGYDWVEDADAMYAKAEQYAGKVIYDQNTYRLDPSLDDIYSVFCQNSSPEHIFITGMNREASGMEGTFAQLPLLFMIQYSDDYVYVSEKLVPETDPVTGKVKVMKMIDSKPGWETVRTSYEWWNNTFEDKDLRKRLLVSTIYTEDGDVFRTFDPENKQSTDMHTSKYFFPFCRKYSDPISVGSRSSANIYLIRMGEIYLNYAEAAGPTDKGYECLNAVRDRAGLAAAPAGLSKEDFREACWKERERELFFEANWLYDLRRKNRVNDTYITRIHPKESIAYFFPFPQRETDLNPQ